MEYWLLVAQAHAADTGVGHLFMNTSGKLYRKPVSTLRESRTPSRNPRDMAGKGMQRVCMASWGSVSKRTLKMECHRCYGVAPLHIDQVICLASNSFSCATLTYFGCVSQLVIAIFSIFSPKNLLCGSHLWQAIYTQVVRGQDSTLGSMLPMEAFLFYSENWFWVFSIYR